MPPALAAWGWGMFIVDVLVPPAGGMMIVVTVCARACRVDSHCLIPPRRSALRYFSAETSPSAASSPYPLNQRAP